MYAQIKRWVIFSSIMLSISYNVSLYRYVLNKTRKLAAENCYEESRVFARQFLFHITFADNVSEESAEDVQTAETSKNLFFDTVGSIFVNGAIFRALFTVKFLPLSYRLLRLFSRCRNLRL